MPIDYEREIKMMTSPDEWPRWPYLPIKRRDTESRSPKMECALMIDRAEPIQPVVFFATLFDGPNATTDSKTYVDFEGLVDDGWVVD